MNRRTLLAASAVGAIASLIDPVATNAAVLPPSFLQCVVAIGYTSPQLLNGVLFPNWWQTIGTGFFWGELEKDDPDPAKRLYSPYLVTAYHVVEDYTKVQKSNDKASAMKVRIDPAQAGLPVRELLLSDLADPGAIWTKNPNGKDVGAIPVDLQRLRDQKYDSVFYASDLWAADVAKMKDVGVGEGDGVFVLGFPMGMSGAQKNYVIVRQGIIARIAELMDGAADSFLIDSLVYPGNSGGPVILRPEGPLDYIQGTKGNNNAYLIGIVIEYIPYTDYAVSLQTGRPRITFEENAGLGRILPVDYIHDAVLAARAVSPPKTPPTKKK